MKFLCKYQEIGELMLRMVLFGFKYQENKEKGLGKVQFAFETKINMNYWRDDSL